MLKPLLDPCSIIRVQTWDSQAVVPSNVEQTLGTAWPQETGATASGSADIICTGPTDWLVIATDPEAAALLERLVEAFEGSPFRVTNVSSALGRVQLEGAHARTLLAKSCALDVHPQTFPPGQCARTR